MDIIAEVLVWSSLGVWAKHTFDTPKLYKNQKPDFVHDIGDYIGKMIRNVTVASIIVILFRLSKISIFEVSLNDDNPFLFDAVVGISFILGVFGDDAYEILTGIKDRIVNSFNSK